VSNIILLGFVNMYLRYKDWSLSLSFFNEVSNVHFVDIIIILVEIKLVHFRCSEWSLER